MKSYLFVLLMFIQLVCNAEYDSTYVLSITQKYAIPEEVSAGDYVGYWKKTVTWVPVGIISYSIEQNFNDAFSISSSSGLITIKEANKINGKIVQQDTLINLIIRSTDSGNGFELDTAKIWIKEASFCVFDNLRTIKAGYGYFMSRGVVTNNSSYNITPFQASADHPTIIGAYGKGADPVFDGGGLEKGKILLQFLRNPNPPAHCMIFNLEIKNYPAEAIKVGQRASYFGFYNLNFSGNVRIDYNADLGDIYTYGYAPDSLLNWHLEIINCNSVGSYGPILKTDASGMSIYNISASPVNNSFTSFRFAISYYSKLKHFHFSNLQGGGKSKGIQARSPHEVLEDGIVENCSWGIYVPWDQVDQVNLMWPDDMTIKNVLLRGNQNGIIVYNSGIDRLTIENCLFDKNDCGILLHNGGNNRVIGYNAFQNNLNAGIQVDSASQVENGLDVFYNTFYGTSKAICIKKGTDIEIYNNTIDGNVDLTGTTSSIVRNNYFRSLINASAESNNIDLDKIKSTDHFQDFANHNYRLIPSNKKAIDQGQNLSLISDIQGSKVPEGRGTDIGAYEYSKKLTAKKNAKK